MGGWSGIAEEGFGDGNLAGATRDFEFSMSTTGFQFAGKSDSILGDSITLGAQFSTDEDDWGTFGLDFSVDTFTSLSSNMNVMLCGLMEFSDDDGDGMYTVDGDTVVNSFSKPSFSSLFSDVSPSDGSYTQLQAMSDDGVITLNVYVANAGATLDNGIEISANELKFDIIINNATYMNDGTMLAVCAYPSATGLTVTQATKDDSLVGMYAPSTGGEYASYFNWEDTADTDGASEVASIMASVDDSTGKVYFTFNTDDQPTMINWDPTLGMSGKSTTTSSGNGASSMKLPIAGAVAVLGALLL